MVSFPFLVKKRYRAGFVVSRKINIKEMEKLRHGRKEEQMLFYYNVGELKQTVLVLDFDKCSGDEKVEGCLEKFQRLNDKFLVLRSFSGYHAMVVVDELFSEEKYREIQCRILAKYFGQVIDKVDIKVSLSSRVGFFHSQHMFQLIESEFVDINKTFRFMKTVPAEELMLLLNERKESELASADLARNYAVRRMNCGQGNRRTWRYIEIESARYIRGILVGGTESDAKTVCTGCASEQKEEQLEVNDSSLSGDAGSEDVFFKGLQKIPGPMAVRLVGRRKMDCPGLIERSRETSEHSCLQGGGEKSDGHCVSCPGWDERIMREGFCRHCSTERVLEFVQAVHILCVGRKVNLDYVGYVLSESGPRSHCDWSNESEESDFKVFNGIVRQVLEGFIWFRTDVGIRPDGIRKWLRCACLCLADIPSIARSLQDIARYAFGSFGLHPETQGVSDNVGQNLRSFIPVDREQAQEVLTSLYENFPKARTSTLGNLFNKDRERLVSGTVLFLEYLLRLSPIIREGRPIDIGIRDFEKFFGVHVGKATMLRDLLMSEFSSFPPSGYVPHVKRRSYHIDISKLMRYGLLNDKSATARLSGPLPASPEELAASLGRGRTWNKMCEMAFPLLLKYGYEESLSFWSRAIDLSTANDKDLRKKEFKRFISLLNKRRRGNDAYAEQRHSAPNS